MQYAILVALFVGFGLLEYAMGRAQRFKANAADNILDVLGFALLAGFSQPLILWLARTIGLHVAPHYENALAHLPWYAMVGLLLVGDDMLQYWWHRTSHSRLLWPLHRAHHSAQYMSARIIYRNNFFYYLAKPAIWVSGALVYLGLGKVYLVYILVKLAVITGAHSDVRPQRAQGPSPAACLFLPLTPIPGHDPSPRPARQRVRPRWIYPSRCRQ